MANTLKKGVINNRQAFLRSKKSLENVDQWMQGGSLKPRLALEMGLIDGLHTQNLFLCRLFFIKNSGWETLK